MNHINILVENEIMRTMGTSFLAAESLAMANGICFRSHKCMRKKKKSRVQDIWSKILLFKLFSFWKSHHT